MWSEERGSKGIGSWGKRERDKMVWREIRQGDRVCGKERAREYKQGIGGLGKGGASGVMRKKEQEPVVYRIIY